MAPHLTPPDGDVFEEIGFPAGEAKNLKIRSLLMLTNAGVPVEVRADGEVA